VLTLPGLPNWASRLMTAVLPVDRDQSAFIRNAATLALGAGAAQLLLLLASPLLTRLYTDEQFGVFASIYSLMVIAGVASTGRYDAAILIQKDPAKAAGIFRLCLRVTTVVAVCALGVVLVFREPLAGLARLNEHSWFLFIIPPFIVIDGLNKAFNAWGLYRTSFTRLSQCKLVQSLVTVVSQSASGVGGSGPTGLLGGQICGQVGALWWLSRPVRADLKTLPPSPAFSPGRLGSEYREFPLLFLPADFINVLANQLPVLMMTSFFGAAVVGWYALTQRVLGAPLSLVSSAILDVFKERSARDFREQGNCLALYKSTFRTLSRAGAIPFLLVALVAPTAFTVLFGPSWTEAGRYAQILAPMFYLRFVASPLSYVLYVAQKPRIDLAWQITLVIVTLLAMILGRFYMSPMIAIASFSGLYSLMYIAYLIICYRVARGDSPTSR
jgi:O-antigen/teichoic acid export membrane protein